MEEPTVRRRSAPYFPNVEGAPGRDVSALEADSALLAYEAELFADRIPSADDFQGHAPVALHLFAISVVIGICAIGPIFEALTPRNSNAIPILQLMVVFLNFAFVWFGIQWIWARVLGPRIRVWVRARFYEWKRWLLVAFVFFLLMKDRS